MIVLKSLTTSFAIYRYQAEIFSVLSDGPLVIAAERLFTCQ